MISLGIEQLVNSPPAWIEGKRIGLLCNQASVDRNFVHSVDLIKRNFPGQLTCLFTPQHGFFSEKQDNMIESDHAHDSDGLPVFSLYGEARRPDAYMYDLIDLLLVDVFDVGTRVYTFASTLAYCLEEAVKHQKKVVILDRPNPIDGNTLEGNILKEDCSSFVGMFPLPMRHGFTFGELALFINDQLKDQADVSVIKMAGWQRNMLFPDTGCTWVYPSPNLPGFYSALVYPGQVIWEGTNISEGRGTTLPFELFGAPFIDHDNLQKEIAGKLSAGCVLRPVCFEPTSNKWSNEVCTGFQLHITNPGSYKPYYVSLVFLGAIIKLYADKFKLKDPPYEYEYERVPLDLILGDKSIREDLQQGRSVADLEAQWFKDLDLFAEQRRPFLLYK